MSKNILLVEPAYKTKYPPLGLMKLSTYHKMKGDEVVFVKGCKKGVQYQYWDRVYISTLFTWTWEETIKTINFYRATLFNLARRCFVGGILASLMPDDLYDATGVVPVAGLLDDPQKIEQDDNVIIDQLAPDYDILKQVENENFKYANTDAYLGYMTRGCIWNCDFCAVKTFEPKYIPYVNMKGTVQDIIKRFGEKQNLILMDNNVLASRKFDQIIDDIKSMGFVKGAISESTKRKRIVDFNQGLDARLLTKEKMQKLSEIPLEPMRIAFDSIELKNIYIEAVSLAHKYGQKEMSNYILYNFRDTPEDFYERLRINIDLNEEFRNSGGAKTTIYSFPMRYIPLNATKRNVDTGNGNWHKRTLRGVQMILNVIKGPVMPGRQFFLQAFGRNAEEFEAITSMPDEFIRYRLVNNWREIDTFDGRWTPYVKDWMSTYEKLTKKEKASLLRAVETNDKNKIQSAYDENSNKRIRKLLEYHLKENEVVSRYKET